MDAGLVTRMVSKVNYSALVGAVAEIRAIGLLLANQIPEIPAERPDLEGSDEGNAAILEALHVVLFNIHVLEGTLTCPDTGRQFPIKDGIPNMMLHEDEI